MQKFNSYAKLAAETALKTFAVLCILAMFCILSAKVGTAGGTADGRGPDFSDGTRTNTWTWANPGNAPVIGLGGTNVTAISTNMTVVRNGITTNNFVFVNGLLVNVY